MIKGVGAGLKGCVCVWWWGVSLLLNAVELHCERHFRELKGRRGAIYLCWLVCQIEESERKRKMEG